MNLTDQTGKTMTDDGDVQSTSRFTTLPEGWRAPSAHDVEDARESSFEALSLDGARPAHERLAAYYDRATDYAGGSFLSLYPNVPDDVTAVDLLATSLLSVTFSASDVRRLIEDSGDRTGVLLALAALPHGDLAVADASTLTLMADLYRAVKESLRDRSAKRSDRWVIASKLCARKRPDLFPVRDSRVRSLLGTESRKSFQHDWLVFRHLMQDAALVQAVDAVHDAVLEISRDRNVQIDDCRLRVLDVALWTYPTQS